MKNEITWKLEAAKVTEVKEAESKFKKTYWTITVEIATDHGERELEIRVFEGSLFDRVRTVAPGCTIEATGFIQPNKNAEPNKPVFINATYIKVVG